MMMASKELTMAPVVDDNDDGDDDDVTNGRV